MRRIAMALVCLMLASSLILGQDSRSRSSGKATVDCSTMNDAGITASVKDRISNTASLKDFNINVTTAGGNVTLTGSVKTGANKGLATRQAKRVPCVKNVDNQLMVEPSSKKTSGK